MNYGRVEERSSSRSRSPSTARRAATSAILTDILSRSDRAQTSHTVNAAQPLSSPASLLRPIRIDAQEFAEAPFVHRAGSEFNDRLRGRFLACREASRKPDRPNNIA